MAEDLTPRGRVLRYYAYLWPMFSSYMRKIMFQTHRVAIIEPKE
jgi:hypothetical protein